MDRAFELLRGSKAITTAGHLPCIAMVEAFIAAISPVTGRIGRPGTKPDAVPADKSHDSFALRAFLDRRGGLASTRAQRRLELHEVFASLAAHMLVPTRPCIQPAGGIAVTDTPAEAVPLSGGRISTGVVRIGDTVRRPVCASSGFMASLLKLLEHRGFTGAPRHVGQDDGADLLSFIPGTVPARFRVWSDRQVAAAASLLRAMHDATRGSDLAGRFDVVCHHDPGPNNVVFQNGLPAAFIDFAEAAPGSRLEDVAYMAWTWSISSKESVPLPRQAEQVRLLADAYGLEPAARRVLVDCILERQARNVRFWAGFPVRSEAAAATAAQLNDRIDWSRREHAYLFTHRDVFDRALT